MEILGGLNLGSSDIWPGTLPLDHQDRLKKFCLQVPGADVKLGQFLGQDIWATADQKKDLRHFLDSCPSLL